MKNKFSLFLTISLACSFLISCATIDQVTDSELAIKEKLEKDNLPPQQWLMEKQKREQILSWEIRGRLSVQTKYDGGVLELIWKQSADEYSIRLIAPLAAGSYYIQGEKDYAKIRYPDGTNKSIENTNDLFLTSLEVDLPTTAIKDWVRGLPAHELSVDNIEWNEQGLIDRINQSGWNVEMKKYTGTETLLPHAIYISRDDDEDIDIRFLLRQWMIDSNIDNGH